MDLLRAGIVAALCTFGVTAQAQTFHIGVAGGSTKSNSSCVGATTCDKTGFGGRAWAGVTNQYGLGLEVVAHDFGAVRTTVDLGGGTTVAAKATLRGIGFGPMFDYREGNWSFHARAGLGRYHTNVRATDGTTLVKDSDNSTEFYWGAGFGYRVIPRLTIIAAVDSTQADNRNAGYQYEAMLYTLGVQFGF